MAHKVSRRKLAGAFVQRYVAEPGRRAELITGLAAYLIEHNMVKDASLLVNDIAHELFVQAGVLNAQVTSARQLGDDIKGQLTEYLKSRLGASEAVLNESVDESLIGGLVARTPDGEIDLSIRTKIKQLNALT